MTSLLPEHLEAEILEDDSHFFRRLGEVKLSANDAFQAEAPSCTSASIRGKVLASTTTGV